MANHDSIPTSALLESISHDVQAYDSSPAVNQAHSLPSSRSPVVENSPILTPADHPRSTHGSVAIAECSLGGWQTELLPSLATANAETDLERNEAKGFLDVAIATVEESSPFTELIEVFRFLDLASEIRNRIYSFALGPPQNSSLCLTQVLDNRPGEAQSGSRDFEWAFRTKSVKANPKHEDEDWGRFHEVVPDDLSILLVSKQIYAEAFHVFYAKNCFYFRDTGLLYRFLKNIGYTRRQHLTMVYFLWRGPDAKEAFRLLKTCRRLKTVQFTVPCSHPPGYEALKEVRVKNAKARALVHFAPAQTLPLTIHDHTSCFGDYNCHCLCRRPYEPASNMQELETAMMRPRREQDLPTAEETFDLFKPKRESFKQSEEQDLLQDKASFDTFIDRFEQQGRQLRYLGRRNKPQEAAQSQTITGPAAVDDYFRDFADKLARDKRLLKWQERWHAKKREEQEARERDERWKRERKEEKERGIQMRREARERKWKAAREARERDKEGAREARELKRRIAREAKERDKEVAREARARKKAAKDAEWAGHEQGD